MVWGILTEQNKPYIPFHLKKGEANNRDLLTGAIWLIIKGLPAPEGESPAPLPPQGGFLDSDNL